MTIINDHQGGESSHSIFSDDSLCSVTTSSVCSSSRKSKRKRKKLSQREYATSLLQNDKLFSVKEKHKSVRMFCHEVATGLAYDTTHEGSRNDETSQEFIYGLQRTNDLLKLFGLEGHIHLPEIQKGATKTKDINTVPLLHLGGVEHLECSEQINDLEVGQSCVIRLAVASSGGGHAMNLIVKRTGRDSFDLSIVNTGAGLGYHKQMKDGDSKKYLSAISYQGIALHHISDPILWGHFGQATIDGVYAIAENHLSKWGVRRNITELVPILFVSEQQAGICSMQVMLDTMRHLILAKTLTENKSVQVAHARYKSFALMYKMQSMMDMAKTYVSSGEYNRDQHSLILDSIGALSKRTDKILDQGFISKECAEALTATLEDIQQKVKVIKQSRDIPPSEVFDPSVTTGTHDGKEESYQLSYVSRVQEQGLYTGRVDATMVFGDTLKPFSGGLTKENISAYLDAFERVLDHPIKGVDIYNKKVVSLYIFELLNSLTLPNNDHFFGKEISGDEAQAIALRLITIYDKVVSKVGHLNTKVYAHRKTGYQGFLLGQKIYEVCEHLLKSSSKERAELLTQIGTFNKGVKTLGNKLFDRPTAEEQSVFDEINSYQQQLKERGLKHCDFSQTQTFKVDSRGAITDIPPPFSHILNITPGNGIPVQEFTRLMQKAVNPEFLNASERNTGLYASSQLYGLMIRNSMLVSACMGGRNLQGYKPRFTIGRSYIDRKDEASMDLVLYRDDYSVLMRRVFESLEKGYYLDGKIVKDLETIQRPTNYDEVNTILTGAIDLLPAKELFTPTPGVISARCVIEQLRKLPPPSDPLWLQIYEEQDVIEFGENLVNLQKQLALIMKSYGRRGRSFHHGVGGLTSSILLTQVHLSTILFEVLKNQHGSHLTNRCLSIPELEFIRSLFLEMEGTRDFELFEKLKQYMKDSLYNGDEVNTPIFTINPNDEIDSTYTHFYRLANNVGDTESRLAYISQGTKEEFYKNFERDFPHLDRLRKVRYYTMMGLSHFTPEISTFVKKKMPSSHHQGRMEDVKFTCRRGVLNIENSSRVREFIRSVDRHDSESEKMENMYIDNEDELEAKRIKKELKTSAYGDKGASLLHLERVIRHYTLNIDKLSVADIHRIGGLLFSDSYIVSQVSSSRELYDNIYQALWQLQDGFRNRELVDHELAVTYLRIKFMSICGSPTELKACYKSVKGHASAAVSHLKLPRDKAKALALRMYTLMQLPKEQWDFYDKVSFCADYLVFRYFTGQQGYPDLLDIDPSIYYLYQMYYDEFVTQLKDPNSTFTQQLMRDIPKRLELTRMIKRDNGQLDRCITETDREVKFVEGKYLVQHRNFDFKNPEEPIHVDIITFDPEKMEILLNDRSPARDQDEELRKLKETLDNKLGNSIASIEPDSSGGYQIIDRFDRKYYVTVNRILDARTGFYELDSYNVMTVIDGDQYMLIVDDPESQNVEQFVEKNTHRSPNCLFFPKDKSKPLLVFSEGFPSLMIEKREGKYDWRYLSPIGKPNERLADVSWIPSKLISGVIGQLGGNSKVVAWTEVQKDGSFDLKRLEFKDINLILDVQKDDKGNKRFYIRGSGGYFIAEDQDTRLKEHLPGMILLNNDKGEEKLLITKTKAKSSDIGAKHYKENLPTLSMFSPASPEEYYVMGVKDVYGQRAIIPRSYSEALYLCEHFVQCQQYKLARYYLTCISAVNEPSKEDMERMERVFLALFERKSPTARALALSLAAQELRFLHMFQRNSSLDKTDLANITAKHRKKLVSLYHLYKTYRKPWTHLDLRKEELELLEETVFSGLGVNTQQEAVNHICSTPGNDCLKSLSVDESCISNLKEQLSVQGFDDVEQFLEGVNWDIQKLFKSSLLWKILLYIETHPEASQRIVDRIALHRYRYQVDEETLIQGGKEDNQFIDRNLQGAYAIDLIYRAALSLGIEGVGKRSKVEQFIKLALSIHDKFDSKVTTLTTKYNQKVDSIQRQYSETIRKLKESENGLWALYKKEDERLRRQNRYVYSGDVPFYNEWKATKDKRTQAEQEFNEIQAEVTREHEEQLQSLSEAREKEINKKFVSLGDILANQPISYGGNKAYVPEYIGALEWSLNDLMKAKDSKKQLTADIVHGKKDRRALTKLDRQHQSYLHQIESELKQDKASLKATYINVKKHAESLKADEEQLAIEILEFAHQLPSENQEAVRRKVLRREKIELTLEHLVNLWRFGSTKPYQEATYLDKDQIKQLDAMIYRYLILSARQMELSRLAVSLEKQNKALEKRGETELSDIALNQLKALMRGPVYEQDFSLRARTLLHFEQRTDLRIRDKQIDFMDKFISLYQKGLIRVNRTTASIEWVDRTEKVLCTDKDKASFRELVAQLGTGSGKSKVLTPLMLSGLILLEYMKGSSNSSVGSVWPEKLYLTNVGDVSHTMKESFGINSIVFEVFRHTDFSDPHVAKTILHEVRQAQLQGRVVNVHPLANRSLVLNHVLLLEQIHLNGKEIHQIQAKLSVGSISSEESKELTKRLNKLNDKRVHLKNAVKVAVCLEEIFSKGSFTNDESHETQNPITGNLKYAYGNRVALPTNHRKIIASIYEVLFLHDEIQKLLKIGENKHKEILMENPQLYREQVAPLIANAAITYLEEFEPSLGEHRDELIPYLIGIAQKKPEFLSNLSKDRQDEIYLCKGMIADELFNALKGSVNKDYGFSKLEKNPIQAIPYKAADEPNEGSEFEKIYYTVAVSAISMAVQGITSDQLKLMASDLYQEALIQARAGNIPMFHTETWKTVRKLFGEITEKRLLALSNGAPFESSDDPTGRFAIRRRFYYFKHYALNSIKFYEKTLSTNPQTQKELLGTLTHLSATPGAVKMYAQSLLYTKDEESEKRVRETLLNKVDNSSVTISSDTDSYEYLHSLTKQVANETNAYMLVDAGACLKGIQPEKVAKRLLKEARKAGRDIQAVEFFNGDKIYVLSIDKPDPVPLKLSTIPIDKRLCYCDNAHLFGADFVLPDRAIGVVSLAGDMSTDTLFQAVGRLRKLSQEQSLHLIVPRSMQKKMEAFQDKTAIQAILSLTDENQKKQKQQKNFISLQQQIHSVVFGPILEKLRTLPLDQQLIMYEQLQSDFIKPSTSSLEEMYGSAQPDRNTASLLYKHLQEVRQLFERANQLNLYSKEDALAIPKALQTYPEIISALIAEGELAQLQGQTKLQNAVHAQAEASESSQSQSQAESQQQQQAARFRPNDRLYRNDQRLEWGKQYDPFCDAWLPGLAVDNSDEAKQKKVQAFGIYQPVEQRITVDRYKEIYQKSVAVHQEYVNKYAEHRSHEHISEIQSKARWGWLGMAASTIGTLGGYYFGYKLYDLFSPKYKRIIVRQLINPEAIDCGTDGDANSASSSSSTPLNDIDQPNRIQNYLAQGRGEFRKMMRLLADKVDANTSSHETARQQLGQAYTGAVDNFFHQDQTGPRVSSHVSPSVWAEQTRAGIGPFNHTQVPLDRYLVITDESSSGQVSIHTVMGSSDDLAHWEWFLQQDRKRFSDGKRPERTRKIELWSVSKGVIERCALGRADGRSPRHDQVIQKALKWEQIKWKLLSGNFQLNQDEMALFEERFLPLRKSHKQQIINFMEQLATTGQFLDGKKSLQYSKEKFLMDYLFKVKQTLS